MARSRLSSAKSRIEAYFDNSGQRVFTPSDLEGVVSRMGAEWRLALSTSVKSFTEFLTERSKLTKVDLKFPTRISTRYVWGEDTSDIIYELALSLKPKSYLSHYTALFFHDLTEQIPKNIYVTYEQPERRRETELSQQAIDTAFKKKVRESSDVTVYKDYTITLLNGQFTGNAGVLKENWTNGRSLAVTNLERTLIDAAVRPVYSGGVMEVLKAYRTASSKVQINKIKAYLKKIDFIYPYFQVIGFYLERAGIPDKRLSYIEDAWEKKFDFYLTHEMQEKSYSERWKLYYPSYL